MKCFICGCEMTSNEPNYYICKKSPNKYSHYEVFSEGCHIFIDKYYIHMHSSRKTSIFTFTENDNCVIRYYWLIDAPPFELTTPENLLNRIKTLLVFS